jgi:hypothetical protein
MHEDIDQLFSTTHTKFHMSSIHTPGITSCFTTSNQKFYMLTTANVHQTFYLYTTSNVHGTSYCSTTFHIDHLFSTTQTKCRSGMLCAVCIPDLSSAEGGHSNSKMGPSTVLAAEAHQQQLVKQQQEKFQLMQTTAETLQ